MGSSHEKELKKLEEKAKNQERITLLIKIISVVIVAYIFLPSLYSTLLYNFGSSDETVAATFSWYYNGKGWNMDLELPKNKYVYYQNLPAPYIDSDFHDSTLTGAITSEDPSIVNVANRLEYLANRERFDRSQLAGFVLAFVQSKEYDWEMGEHVKPPFQTLIEGGDCEDSSILTASLLKVLGYKVALVDAPRHIATAVHINDDGALEYKGESYHYMETTGRGWALGEIPPDFKDSKLRIIPVKD